MKTKRHWRVDIDVSGHITKYVLAETAQKAVDHTVRVCGYFVKPWGKGKISVSPCDEIPVDEDNRNNPGDNQENE